MRHPKAYPGLTLDNPTSGIPPIHPEPIQVVCGSTLCRLHVYSDAEYAALSGAERPLRSTRVSGLGWVVAVAVASLN